MALQQMIDKKNTFSFIELILSSFYKDKFCLQCQFEDCPGSDKILLNWDKPSAFVKRW